jgi:hypothetical protein
VVGHWFGKTPVVFENHDLDLAVAIGAAYYSYVRESGSGVLVRGGLPRAYFLGVQGAEADASAIKAVCLMPRGTEEGAEIKLAEPELQLVANTPVAFRLYSSLSRTEDAAGDVVTLRGDGDLSDPASDPRLHAPLHAVIRFGKGGERLVPVTIGARLSEVGTLETWAASKISEHRWQLEFQLRKTSGAAEPSAKVGVRSSAVISAEAQAAAEELIGQVFGKPGSGLAPEQLPAKMEQALGLGRLSWPLATVRAFADKLLTLADGRKKNAAHEVRWLNLTGFCLRPGFGFPGDDFRIEQARRIYASGITFANQVQCEVDWWIFCGRIAGGLNRNQQADIYQRLSATLVPKQKNKQRLNQSLYREMWRTSSSLELLPTQTKAQLGDALLDILKRGDMFDAGTWCLSRLGARKLFSGPINLVVSPTVVVRWIDGLLKLPHTPALLEAVVQMAQQTGDAARDLPPATLDKVRKALEASSRGSELLKQLAGGEQDLAGSSRVFGEELPAGLVLAAV